MSPQRRRPHRPASTDSKEEEEDEVETIPGLIRDIVISVAVVCMILLVIFAYTQTWPPVVVIESKSMQHSADESFLGVIDTGDLVLVQKINGRDDVTTYIEGRASGYQTYSNHGDVIIFRKNGFVDVTPVIHRAFIWVEYNESSGGYDLPGLQHLVAGTDWDICEQYNVNWSVCERNGNLHTRWYDTLGRVRIYNVGHKDITVEIELSEIKETYGTGIPLTSGFITMGDYNAPHYDQGWLTDGHFHEVRLVEPNWVVGVARGEIPWFGIIKLSLTSTGEPAPANSLTLLIVSIVLIIGLPLGLDFALVLKEKYGGKKKGKEEEEEEEKEEDKAEDEDKDKGEEREGENSDPPEPEPDRNHRVETND